MRGRRRRGLDRLAWVMSEQTDPICVAIRKRCIVLVCRDCGEIARWTPAHRIPVPLDAMITMADLHSRNHLDS